MGLVSVSDFEGGAYNITDSTSAYADADLQECIDKYHDRYIILLFGKELGDLIISYINDNRLPIDDDLEKLIEPFTDQPQEFCHNYILISDGLKEFLKAAIFYEYVRSALKTVQAGVKKSKVETGESASVWGQYRFAEKKFNDQVETAEAIREYCLINGDNATFAKYKGVTIYVKAANMGI